MEILNELRQKVTETAQSAWKKSNEIVEVTKINIAISDAQTHMDKMFKDIGKIVYDAYKEGDAISGVIGEKCQQIDEKAVEIYEMKLKISQIKNVKVCPECEKENEAEATFCSKCGRKIGEDELEIETDE